MKRDDYHHMTQQLLENLQADPRVVGLVALGSMAEQSRTPDEWSDHDFFVIVESGTQEDFRQNLAWLPQPEHIILQIRETAHGLKILYDLPHLLEFAIFDHTELRGAVVNDYTILLDRAGIAQIMPTCQPSPQQPYNPRRDFQMVLALIYVAAGRGARGETLSAHAFIKHHLLHHLLPLLAHLSGTPLEDNLDPFRRFETTYPALGKRIHQALLLPPLDCAYDLLELLLEHAHYPDDLSALTLVKDYLSSM